MSVYFPLERMTSRRNHEKNRNTNRYRKLPMLIILLSIAFLFYTILPLWYTILLAKDDYSNITWKSDFIDILIFSDYLCYRSPISLHSHEPLEIQYLFLLTNVDMGVSIILPFFLILLLNLLIVCKLKNWKPLKNFHLRINIRVNPNSNSNPNPNSIMAIERHLLLILTDLSENKITGSTYNKLNKSSERLLLLLPFIFLILNIPFAIYQRWQTFSYMPSRFMGGILSEGGCNSLNQTETIMNKLNCFVFLNPIIEEIAEKIVYILYYINFTFIFFLLSVFNLETIKRILLGKQANTERIQFAQNSKSKRPSPRILKVNRHEEIPLQMHLQPNLVVENSETRLKSLFRKISKDLGEINIKETSIRN